MKASILQTMPRLDNLSVCKPPPNPSLHLWPQHINFILFDLLYGRGRWKQILQKHQNKTNQHFWAINCILSAVWTFQSPHPPTAHTPIRQSTSYWDRLFYSKRAFNSRGIRPSRRLKGNSTENSHITAILNYGFISIGQVRNGFHLSFMVKQSCRQITFNVSSGFLSVSVTLSLCLCVWALDVSLMLLLSSHSLNKTSLLRWHMFILCVAFKKWRVCAVLK